MVDRDAAGFVEQLLRSRISHDRGIDSTQHRVNAVSRMILVSASFRAVMSRMKPVNNVLILY